ncbi:MAG: xanthine dehydrogenase family protein subunit M [Rhodospirillales bacterium]|nr:xanthine dehydrogenase family protein subunit M [Rhodospirillales bacterium]
MRPFEFVAPETAEKAVAILAENSPNAKPLAGGTDMVVDLKHTNAVPKVVVDLNKIEEFRGIEMTDRGLRIGSLVTHTEIMEHPLVAEHAPAMIDAARTIGAVQTRNLGTLGGNLVTCVPSLDSGPVLVALDAEVTVVGNDGRRQMPLTEFFVGPRKTALNPDELLADIIVPTAMLGRATHFLKFGLRKGQALALVNGASSLRLDGGKVADARIALGAVAPVVIRAGKAEDLVNGTDADEAVLAEAGDLAAGECKPIDDFRASADYRRDLVRVLTKRTLETAYAIAKDKG